MVENTQAIRWLTLASTLLGSQNLSTFETFHNLQETEAVAQRCSVKKVFLIISQNSQENTSARVSFFHKT